MRSERPDPERDTITIRVVSTPSWQAGQARRLRLAMIDYDSALPPAVRAAVTPGLAAVRAASDVDRAWVQAQLAKRAAHRRQMAALLGIDPDTFNPAAISVGIRP